MPFCIWQLSVPAASNPSAAASDDLLGLNSPGPAAPSAGSFLLDVFDTVGSSPPTNGVDSNGLTPGAEESFKKYVYSAELFVLCVYMPNSLCYVCICWALCFGMICMFIFFLGIKLISNKKLWSKFYFSK